LPVEGFVAEERQVKNPKIKIHGTSQVFEGNLTTSILNILLRNDFPIQTLCGGKAECGKDLIRIKAGERSFSALKEREMKILKDLAARGGPSGPDIRLACQSYVHGDVEIEVFHLAGRHGKGQK
jgi:ferredoxin